MVAFTLVFGKFADFPSKGIPYPIFVYSALLPWTYFAGSVAQSSNSLVSNRVARDQGLLPANPAAARRRDGSDRRLPARVRRAPRDDGVVHDLAEPRASFSRRSSCSWALVTALGVGLFLSAVNVRYRDVPYAIPFLIQIWLYFSGVVYAISALPEKWQWVLALNPMTAVISGFQWGVVSTARVRTRARRSSASRRWPSSSSSASGTSAAPSPSSRTRSDGDRSLGRAALEALPDRGAPERVRHPA